MAEEIRVPSHRGNHRVSRRSVCFPGRNARGRRGGGACRGSWNRLLGHCRAIRSAWFSWAIAANAGGLGAGCDFWFSCCVLFFEDAHLKAVSAIRLRNEAHRNSAAGMPLFTALAEL